MRGGHTVWEILFNPIFGTLTLPFRTCSNDYKATRDITINCLKSEKENTIEEMDGRWHLLVSHLLQLQ